ncbi:hypothetical protein LMG920_09560 [Xanthomonas vesicatoria]|nr:hypothetical protein LMG920_09560 [Xanthomonas vesicatoria]
MRRRAPALRWREALSSNFNRVRRRSCVSARAHRWQRVDAPTLASLPAQRHAHGALRATSKAVQQFAAPAAAHYLQKMRTTNPPDSPAA